VRSVTPVIVNLNLTTAQSGGDATGDLLSGIENVTGSIVGGDFLTGDANDNILSGLDGNDKLIGNAGNDVLLGGLGNDILNGGDGDDISPAVTATTLLRVGTVTISSMAA
jgi:Ca2+-binding RTX toxin-like protein